ncbi:MAG: lipopolysaccharide biosynthesis protein [Thermodesulfobacteriota bacterium]
MTMNFPIVSRIFPEGRFSRNTAILVSHTAFGQGLGILMMPLLTRLYNPEDFGVVAIYTSSLSILLVLSSMRYEWAIPIAKDQESATHLLSLCLIILSGFSLIIGFGIWLGQNQIRQWSVISTIRPYLWVLALGFFGAGAYQVLNAWAVRERDFDALAKTKITQSVSGSAVQIGVGLVKGGPLGLLLGSLLSQAAGIETLAFLLWRRHKGVLRKISWAGIRGVASRYYKFPLLSAGSSLLNVAGLQLMPILLATVYGSTVVGWLALSQQVLSIPKTFIGNATAQTFWGEASYLIKEDAKGLQSLFYEVTKRLLTLSLLIILIGVISPAVFGWVFGKQRWEMAGIYALYLIPMFMTQFVASAVSHLIVHELQHWQLLWDAGRLILIGMCIWTGSLLSWSPEGTIILYSLAMSLMYGVLFVMNAYALRLKIRRKT